MRTEQEMFEIIINIAKDDERIRAAYLHGSRANSSDEKDKYSDYDVVYVVTEMGSFINDKEWIKSFGDIIFIFEGHLNQNNFFMKEINDLSRRYCWSMLFNDGNRVDLMIEIIEEAMNHIHIKNKPTTLLLDKDGCLPEIHSSNNKDYSVKKPCEKEYVACCSGFWWFLCNVAKGIARDQLAYSKEEFNSKNLAALNRMIGWYIDIKTNFSVSQRDSRYYKKYLPADIYDLYTKIYSDSDYSNFWNAIFSTCELFSKIASGVSDFFSFNYNKQEENNMIEYLTKIKNEML